MTRRTARASAALGLVLALVATPLPAAAGERPDPLDPAAVVPPLVVPSTLAAYRRTADTPAGDWKAANEQVARIGGWRAYLREASRTEPAHAARPASAAGSGHGRH